MITADGDENQQLKSRLTGVGYIAVSACAFAAMAIFAKYAYASGAGTLTVLLLRFGIASLVMTAVMCIGGYRWPRGRNLLVLIGMGSLGYVGQSFCFFNALNFASAGLVALLLYLHPAIVTIAGSIFLGYRLSIVKCIAIAAALAGTAMTIGGDSSGSLTGVVLGICAAFIYSGYILVGSRMLKSESPLAASTVIMISATVVYTVLNAATGTNFPATLAGWLAAACIALISTVVAMITFFAGLKRLSPGDAATISTLEPLVTVLMAAVFLGEPLTTLKVTGGVVIVLSLIALARTR